MNWADLIWALALVAGVVGGLRAGVLNEFLRLLAWALIAGVLTKIAPALELVVLVGIAIGLLLVAWVIRNLVCKITGPPGLFSRLIGLVLGVVRMVGLMIFLTLSVAQMKNPFWHRQVCVESQCGATVLQLFRNTPAPTSIQRTI